MAKGPLSCLDARFMTLVLGMAAVIIAAAVAAKSFERGSAMRIAMAAVQTLATAVVIVAPVQAIRRLDELQQRIHLEALAFAFAGTGVLATGYGFLINAGLPNIDWGALDWPVMVGLWAIGLAFANRRYR